MINCKQNSINPLIIVAVLTLSMQSNAAEFGYDDIVPEVTSLVFTGNSIALTLEPAHVKGSIASTESYERFFIANRTDREFHQVAEQEFSALLQNDHFHKQIAGYRKHDFNVQLSERCADYGLPDSVVAKEFTFDETTIRVNMLCRTEIVDALLTRDELWIVTAEFGDHGEYGAEGLLIASLEGSINARIDIGNFAATAIARDPWSSDIWALTRSQLTVVSEDHTINNRYWAVHDFDYANERPDVFVSSEKNATDPLAILAYTLGEKHYAKFSRSIKDATYVRDQNLLYNYMSSDSYRYRPQLPQELNVLLNVIEPTIAWRRFVCMLNSNRAEELCNLELNNWPDILH